MNNDPNAPTTPAADTKPGDLVDSASDLRQVNNTMRHQYRALDDQGKADMLALKDKGLEFIALLHRIGGTDPAGDRFASRELSLAGTNAEQAVMWAVKHVTR